MSSKFIRAEIITLPGEEAFFRVLREYVARHAPDATTEAMNRACDQVSTEPDMFLTVAARRILERVEW